MARARYVDVFIQLIENASAEDIKTALVEGLRHEQFSYKKMTGINALLRTVADKLSDT